MQVGVDVLPLAAKLDEFVYGNDVAGNNTFSEVQEIVWDEPKVENRVSVEVVVEN